MTLGTIDPVERRRNQNRMAQRRFRSKKASESGKKTCHGMVSSRSEANTISNAALGSLSSADVDIQTLNSATNKSLSHDNNGGSKRAEESVSPVSTDLLRSLSATVQDLLLPSGHDGFQAANPSLSGFVHQGPQNSSLVNPDDFSYVSSSLTNKLQDPLPLPAPDDAFYAQSSRPDPGSNFSITSDQMTPSSLYDSSDAGSITLSATGYRMELCKDCSGPRVRSPPHLCKQNIAHHHLPKSKKPKSSIPDSQINPNQDNTPSSPDTDFESTLHIAAESGYTELVDLLLRSGSTVDESDSEGNTALHRATSACHLSVIQNLLWHGADPNKLNATGRTPVHIAASKGSMEIVETLVRFSGDLNRRARRRGSREEEKRGKGG